MKTYISILFLAILFSGCEDVIPIELNENDEFIYAVEARITTINEPWVHFCRAVNVNTDTLYDGISNAIITITDITEPINKVTLEENIEEKGFYYVPQNTEYFGQIGRTYALEIVTMDNDTIRSIETLNRVEIIDSIQVRPSLRGDKRFLGVFTYGQETEGLGNYYKWDIFINDTLLSDASNIAFASDELVDGNYVDGLEIFTDYYESREEEPEINLNDTVMVQQTSVSAFAYDFYFQMVNQANSGSLFSVSPANLPTNLTTSSGVKVYGIFNAQDISISNEVVVDSVLISQLREL